MADEAERNILIIFVKYPEPGRVKTRLAATIGSEAASCVYRALAEQTLKALLPSTSYDCWIFFDPPERENEIADWLNPRRFGARLLPQASGDLGTRMANAFQRAFEAGQAKKTIIIGTDCPAMDTGMIKRGFEALEHSPVVLGPSSDGGYYLLGTNGFYPWIFNQISWSTETVFSSTVEALERRDFTWTALPQLEDIDTEGDLERLWPAWREALACRDSQ